MKKQLQRKFINIILAIAFILVLIPTAPKISAEDFTVRVLVEPSLEFDEVNSFSEGLAVVGKYDVGLRKKYGFIDKAGNIVVPLEYDRSPMASHYKFSEGIAIIKKDNKYGYVDKTGKMITPIEYDYGTGFFNEDGFAIVSIGGNDDFGDGGEYGIIDKTGKVVVPIGQYDSIDSFSEGLASVRKDGKYGYIDKTGNVTIPLDYDIAMSFSEGLARVQKDGKYGFIDKTGKVIVPFEYDYGTDSFNKEGLAIVRKDSKYGCIDKTGKIIAPLEYDSIQTFREGLARVSKDGKYGKEGVIDKTGKVIVPFGEYDSIDSVSKKGIIKVQKDGKYGFIDKTGKVIVPIGQYNTMNTYSNEGIAKVGIKVNNVHKYGYIDKTGKVVVPLEYDDVDFYSNEGLAWVKKDRKYGILEIVGSKQSPANLAVVPSPQKVFLNNKEIQFNAYNINGNNYFKLRDLAYVFNH